MRLKVYSLLVVLAIAAIASSAPGIPVASWNVRLVDHSVAGRLLESVGIDPFDHSRFSYLEPAVRHLDLAKQSRA